MEDHLKLISIVDYSISGLDFLLFLWAAIQLIRIIQNEKLMTLREEALNLIRGSSFITLEKKEHPWNWKKSYHLVAMFCMLLRASFFAYQPWYASSDVTFEYGEVIFMLWYQSGSALFLLAHFLLLLVWGDFYHKLEGNTNSCHGKIKAPLFFFLSFLLASFLSFTLVALLSSEDIDSLGMISSGYICILSLCIALAFLYYGGRMSIGLRRFRIFHSTKAATTFKIGIVALICALCFAMRAVFMFFSLTRVLVNPLEEHQREFNISWYGVLCFFLFFEVVPISLMLFMLRRIPNLKQDPSIYRESFLYTV